MRRWIVAVVFAFFLALSPSAARADGVRVFARLPSERSEEMIAALRIELAGRGELAIGAALRDELTRSTMREQALAAGATHALWIVFPGGVLAPAEVRVLDLNRSAAAHAMAPQAWDVVDPRVVAVLATSLLDATAEDVMPMPEGATVIGEPLPLATRVEIVEAPEPSAPAAEAAPAADAAVPGSALLSEARGAYASAPPPRARDRRTFSFAFGLGIGHLTRPGEPTTLTSGGPMIFYARLSDWASIGLRFSIGGGASSVEGAILTVDAALPSFAASFRESLGTAAAIEVGAHVEGSLIVNWTENDVRGKDLLTFGLGAGAFVSLELGAANGLLLDYTFQVFGFGADGTSTRGTATFAYVHRWN